ncbi:hypothetical protein NDU88_002948 [Pleurodeles waltl]|uniref:Uncharacterized protein n=1 Tax=Pleurodeles waltl TaxID=8319 RepID=A0AAV7UCL1_PLEWA|nr:hypothetical protein NDU88_002948 [Pleurodeles waltl]
MAELKKRCKEMGLTLEKEATKENSQIYFRVYEEFCRIQATTREGEGNDPEEEVDGKKEDKDEEGDGMAVGPKVQQVEGNLPTGVRPLQRGSVSSHSLSSEERRRADREIQLQLTKLKLEDAAAHLVLEEKKRLVSTGWDRLGLPERNVGVSNVKWDLLEKLRKALRDTFSVLYVLALLYCFRRMPGRFI